MLFSSRSIACFTFLLYIPCYAKTSSNSTSRAAKHNSDVFILKDISHAFASEFNNTSNEELGVAFIQQMYGKFKYASVLQDAEKKLPKIASQLELKLNETFSFLSHTRSFIENYYKNDDFFFVSTLAPCLEDEDFDEYDLTDLNSPIDTYVEQAVVDLGQFLRQQKASSALLKDLIKQQYFLSHQDVASETNIPMNSCNNLSDKLMWSTYQARVGSPPKNVLLLLDHGGSLSKHQFTIVKAMAKQVISLLGEEDHLGILAVAEDVSRPYLTPECVVPNIARPQSYDDVETMTTASEHNKMLFHKFVDGLGKGNGSTNHTMGFQQAFHMIKSSNITNNASVMLLYISRGLLSSLTEARVVLETICGHMEEEGDRSVIINTCAVLDDSKPVMYETHFLRNIAEQNYTKYNLDFDETPSMHRGIMLPVNSTATVGLAIARFFHTITHQRPTYLSSNMLSLPQWDARSQCLIVTASIPVGVRGEIGVLAIDLDFAALMEDVTYYSNYVNYSYAFLTDVSGKTIVHPFYPRPAVAREVPHFRDVERFEPRFGKYLNRFTASEVHLTFANVRIKYIWQRVAQYYNMVIVVREFRGVDPPQRPFKVTWFPTRTASQLVHHRLDIIPATRMCKHFNQLATLDAGSLYLSASCFQSPTTYLQTSTSSSFSPLTVQKCMAFLKDNTRFLSNPGLREEIRDDVASLAHILEYLRNQHLQGAKGRYVVRRYVASPTGVLQIFPGGILSPGFEPTRRTWYLRAVEHRYKTIVTPPYLDAGGAGYIVTMAYATEHAVVGMDVTFGYVYKLLLEHMYFCTDKKVKCFIMDDRGYLIYHPNLIDPNGHGPIEQQHIIHKEPQVANDILYHSHFIRKVLCNNFADGTIQRYYTLNTSIDEVIVNAVNGEHNAKYQVSPVEGTNLFIGYVNVSEESVATFCPCSMINRLCLNCNRMEQKECECPCECPMTSDSCPAGNKTSALCPLMPEQSFSIPKKHFGLGGVGVGGGGGIMEELQPCLPIACEKLNTYESCLGVLGCEWCQVDVDAETLLGTPFCTSIQTCFNGILGSPTPYGDGAERTLDADDLLGNTYSPIAPVIGSVLAVCLILIFSFICYRSYTSPTDRFYLSSAQDNQVRMSDLNISDDYHELDNHQDKLLQDSKKAEPISPYCVSTGYRRPPTAADSDHGYSTMTPHEESEHLSFAPHEIDSLEDETSDGASIGTSVSTKRRIRLMEHARAKSKMQLLPAAAADATTTVLHRNRVIAPVTVHRNMECAQ